MGTATSSSHLTLEAHATQSNGIPKLWDRLLTAPAPLPPTRPRFAEAPNGAPYWFNPITNVSTYTRPVAPPPPPGFPVAGAPPPPPGFPVAAPAGGALPPLHFPGGASTAPVPAAKKEKKEKPKEKLPIEGSDWIRVTTNKGNVFFNNKQTRESVWTVPAEIMEQVEALERKEREDKERVEREEREERDKAMAEASAASKKRKAEDDEPAAAPVKAGVAEPEDTAAVEDDDEQERGELDLEIEGAGDGAAIGVPEEAPPAAVPATAPAPDPAASDEPPKKKKKTKAKVVASLEDLADEDWQRSIAAQMAEEAAAAEAGEPQGGDEAVAGRKEDGPASEDARALAQRLEVNAIEAAAMFKVLLSEKDINPMAPFESELAKLVNDPRYHAVKSTRERRDLFDEFCKEKIREQRAAKKKAAASGIKVDPLVAFRALLSSTVTSTRTHFSDFKRAHQKDARYREFGKTEGDREKEFKRYLRDLGERKREAAEKAEREFGEMLREDGEIRPGDKWADVKKRHASDARYSAVNSSSLREQLFGKHLAALASGGAPSSSSKGTAAAPAPTTKEDKAARAAASLREREERVRAEKARAERSANVARGALGKEEAEREFAQLLIDAVRDHKARFEDLAPSLSRDPRFDGQALHPSDKRRLFEQHQQKLHRSRVADVEALFAAHSPRLTTPFHDVLPAISSDPHVSRLVGSDFDALEALYEQWLARRTQRAREDFSQMLRESPILEHWGRMRKLEKREKVALIGQEGTRNDESDDDEADTREMAEQIDLKAIHAVLKNDKRYLEFDHVPEERERWVEEYTENLAAPKATVHQRD
ncbi:peptide-binding protein [Rhodotorula diobovata]|uniref:Peptide-binding protein n=1 Tax=Rhodotorula diobovata TaxID=5288 RepID=A0A5C5FPJ5_9BASI|nr:peptide-binding protein [Rhodotorula diobovata]